MMYVYIHIYVHIYVCVCTCLYVDAYIVCLFIHLCLCSVYVYKCPGCIQGSAHPASSGGRAPLALPRHQRGGLHPRSQALRVPRVWTSAALAFPEKWRTHTLHHRSQTINRPLAGNPEPISSDCGTHKTDVGLGFQVKVLTPFQIVPFSLGSRFMFMCSLFLGTRGEVLCPSLMYVCIRV